MTRNIYVHLLNLETGSPARSTKHQISCGVGILPTRRRFLIKANFPRRWWQVFRQFPNFS